MNTVNECNCNYNLNTKPEQNLAHHTYRGNQVEEVREKDPHVGLKLQEN